MSLSRDPYAVLGVPRHAAPQEISRAYRVLLRRYHPDTRPPVAAASPAGGPASDARLQDILMAYAALRKTRGRAAGAAATYEPHATRIPVTIHRAPAPPGRQAPTIVAGPVRWGPSEVRGR